MVQQHQMVNQVRAAGCSSRCTAPELQTHAQPSSGMHTAVVGTCTLLQHHALREEIKNMHGLRIFTSTPKP
ncbi:hypothetical protein Anapl_12676 [Anas platyrhynchos]|uniref:Uncharacterized protein n=1 Tax=Anas platyrhynchos TaxID=8839 RepID=R0JXT4_ANAPL|nr:hypothetical protein Anapl_12676 [Anas platyrhynchos]